MVKDLQYGNYSTSSTGTMIVEFNDPSFHLKTQKCFSNEEKDSLCQFLLDKVKQREKREVERLYQLFAVMKQVSTTSLPDNDPSNSSLKDIIQLYFKDQLTPEYLHSLAINPYQLVQMQQPLSERLLFRVRADIRTLISNNDDRVFTGRAVARILQGISSPCYPAEIWGRKVFYWRKYLDIEFDTLCKIATEEMTNNYSIIRK